MKEKASLLLSAALVIVAIGLSFWINAYLGLFILLFCMATLGYVLGVYKKRVDRVLAEVARSTGLHYRGNRFTHAVLHGEYRGYPTVVEIRAGYEGAGGAGTLLAATTGLGGFAALEVGNHTVIRMRLGFRLEEKVVLSAEWPRVLARGDEILLSLPHVSQDAGEIERAMDRLIHEAERLRGQRGAGR
jgi:hypothetical protein